MILKKPFFLLLCLMLTSSVYGQTFVGTIVSTSGDVKILKPSKKRGPFTLYAGKKLSYKKARIGQKVRQKEILHSGPNGKVKIVYKNGDHLSIGPGTSMTMPILNSKIQKKKSSQLNLYYGKVRAMISKKGPRNKMEVKTPSAVAGVRGTDFFVSHQGNNQTQLTVLRGEVEVSKKIGKNKVSKPISVKTGFTANIEKNKNEPINQPPKIQIEQASKENLLDVQQISSIKEPPTLIASLSKEVQQEVENLQKASTHATLEDIKEEDPKMYEKIKDKKITDISSISTEVVAKLYKKAPRKDKKKKPSLDEIEGLGDDVYNKYFKTNDD